MKILGLLNIFSAMISLVFLVQDSKRWWHAITFGFCLGVGILLLVFPECD